MKQRVKKDLENQYASSEEWIERETEQFFMKQGRIILAEVVIGIILLIILIFSMIFFRSILFLRGIHLDRE